MILIMWSYSISQFIRILTISPSFQVEDFFFSVLKDTVKYRESNARKRTDFLQLLIDIQTEEIKQHQSEKSQRNGIQNGAQNGIRNGHADNSAETQKGLCPADFVSFNAI